MAKNRVVCPYCKGKGKSSGPYGEDGDGPNITYACSYCGGWNKDPIHLMGNVREGFSMVKKAGSGYIEYDKDCSCGSCKSVGRKMEENSQTPNSSGSSDDDQEFWGGVGIIVGLFLIVSFLKFLWDTYIFPFYKNYVESVIDWLNGWNGIIILILIIIVSSILFYKKK